MTAVSTVRVGASNKATPGAYSKAVTTGAQVSNPISGGRVALVGEAASGEPQVAQTFASLQALREAFAVNDATGVLGLRLAGRIVYDAAADPNVQGSPESVTTVKVNRDTQGTGVLQGATGDLINLTTEDYGAHVNSIRVSVAPGTNGGVAVTITKGTTVESGDDIGADAALTVEHTGEATTANVDIDVAGLQVNFTKTDAGESGGEIAVGWTSGTPRVKSASALDDYQQITLYGLDGANAPISDTLDLNGTSYVTSAVTFAKLTGAKVNGLSVGNITVEDGAPVVKCTISSTLSAGMTAGKLKVSSASASDVGLVLQATGYSAGGTLLTENLTLNGTTVVTGTLDFADLLKVSIVGTTAGIVTVTDSVPATLLTLAAGTNPSAGFFNTAGLYEPQTLPIASALSVAGTGAYEVVVRGTDDSGSAVAERLQDGAGGTQTTSATMASITHIELGTTVVATTLTYSGEMVNRDDLETLDDVADFLNDTGAFTASSFQDARVLSEMDYVAAINCLSPTVASLYSQASDVVDWINDNSDLLTATRVSGASGLPLTTTTPVAISGGTTVTPTVADWQAAIDLLKEEEVDIVVALTTNASVHSYLKDHVDWSKNTAERFGHVGLPSNQTIVQTDALTVVINDDMVCCWGQTVDLYDDDGVKRTYTPVAQALVAAGMQAATSIGEPLTRKYANVLDIGQSQWSPVNDGEQLLRNGLAFMEKKAGKGIRVVRSITSYRKATNRVFTELSANESYRKSIQDLREHLDETVVGTTTVRPPLEVVRGDAIARLVYQRDTLGMIQDFANVTVTETADTVYVDYDVAPVFPRNFVFLTAHAAIAVQQAA